MDNAQVENLEHKENEKPKKAKKDKKKVFGIVSFVVGLLVLAGGLAFLLYNLFKAPDVRDAEYLVEVGAWQLEDELTVVWNFTEIGKGKLTTNFYINEYDFLWAMDGDQLKIETDWLYTLNNEYTYELDQGAKTLTLKNGEETFTFIPAPIQTEEETEETN